MKPELKTVYGQPSYGINSDMVDVWVTRTGGHLGPVTFNLNGHKVQPYSIAPWAEEAIDHRLPPIIQALRGDFFCLPFGGNENLVKNERHPVHGESANGHWAVEECENGGTEALLHLTMPTSVRAGRIDKKIRLLKGHNALYMKHVISGMTGPMSLGHHAMLKLPEREGAGNISTSAFVHGQVLPVPFENPEHGGYSTLKPGATFKSLEKVALSTGGTTDISSYPARRGFDDLALIVSNTKVPFAWTAVTLPKEKYVWFAIKDPNVQRETIFWMSNGGRHYPPWSGRHHGVLGIEDVTSYFHIGLAESVKKNELSDKGYPTVVKLTSRKPTVVNYIMGAAPIPGGFKRVKEIKAADENSIVLISNKGKSVTVPLDHGFLTSP